MSSHPLKIILVILSGALLFGLLARFLLPIAMPFLLGGALALAAEPLVGFFNRKLRLPRGLSVGVGVTLTVCLLTLTATVLGALLLRQLQTLVSVVPDLEGTALDGLSSLQKWLLGAAEKAPGPIRSLMVRSVEGFFAEGNNLVDKLSGWVLGLASGVVSKLPGSALVVGTCLISSFMISARLPLLREKLSEKLPQNWKNTIKPTLQRLKKTVFAWLTAQLKLMAITFGVLTIGLWVLRFDHTLVWAIGISILDALPVLGSGVALVPWSLVCLLRGDMVRAVGLLGIYATAAILRSILEPKLLGKQLGLDPLVTLAAIYAGYKLWGFGGMLLAPLLAVTAMELFSATREH